MAKSASSAKPPAAIGEMRLLASLRPNPLNPRTPGVEDPGMEELVASIRATGLLQPLLVTPDGLIVAGHRRAIACQAAGLTEVPVIVRDLDEAAQIEAMLIENMQRQALNPLETARACQALYDRGLTVPEIADRTGMAKATVSKYRQILDLPTELQVKAADGSLPLGYVPILNGLRSQKKKLEVGLKAIAGNWLNNQLNSVVNCLLRGERPPEYRLTKDGVSVEIDVEKTPAENERDQKRNALSYCRHALGCIATSLSRFPEYRPYIELASDLDVKLGEEQEELVGLRRRRRT